MWIEIEQSSKWNALLAIKIIQFPNWKTIDYPISIRKTSSAYFFFTGSEL